MKYKSVEYLTKPVEEISNAQLNKRLKETKYALNALIASTNHHKVNMQKLENEASEQMKEYNEEITRIQNSIAVNNENITNLNSEVEDILQEINRKHDAGIVMYTYEELEEQGQQTFSFV